MSVATAGAAHASGGGLPGINVYVGYADSLRAGASFPAPWVGDPNTTCINCTTPVTFNYDAGAIRLDNITSNSIPVDSVTVTVPGWTTGGTPTGTANLWGSFAVPAHSSIILTQTADVSQPGYPNDFDTSDFGSNTCGVDDGSKPTVKISVNSGAAVQTFTDSGEVLNTGGFDLACLHNESEPWVQIGQSACATNDLALTPAMQTHALGDTADVMATLTACGNPDPNSTINFSVTSGPNAGKTGSAVTDANGVAHFDYTSTSEGTDSVTASFTNVVGATINADAPVSVVWLGSRLGQGAFVIGDLSAGAPTNGTGVLFWGAQWWKANSLSGGTAPAAFKGFEDALGNPTCGQTWTTDPGNSTPPPNGPLPSHMVVIVSSAITKSGSTISGNVLHVVVVSVNPGYAPDPGHAGTGTIITTLC